MPYFNVELTDPTPQALEKAMADAVEQANLRCRVGVMKADRPAYLTFAADEYPASPEGVAMWVAEKGRVTTYPPTPRATLLGVAWRTTPVGQRIVRVAGLRVEPFKEHATNRFGPPWREWPAWCHLEPDHVIVRTLAGRGPEAVALCECGAFGPPAKLGWMRGRCGPCHDHLEEHGTPLADSDGPPVLRTDGQLTSVAFLLSGRTVVAVEYTKPREAELVTVWDRRTGVGRAELTTLSRTGRVPAATAAGGVAVGLVSKHQFVWVADVPKPPREAYQVPSATNAVVFHGTTVVALGYDGSVSSREMAKPKSRWHTHWGDRRDGRPNIYFSLAFDPAKTRLALGMTDATVELLDWPAGGGRSLQPPSAFGELAVQRVFALAFSPDGKLLACGIGRSGFVDDPSENWWGRGGGVVVYDAATGDVRATFPTPNDDILAVAFSPDGTLLFVGSTDCTVWAIDVAQWTEVVRLSGHVGGVNALAFSPDGETLASAGGDGMVRLWPWRQLVQG